MVERDARIERVASETIAAIERRVVYMAEQSHRVVDAFFAGQLGGGTVDRILDEERERGAPELDDRTRLTPERLDRYASTWVALLPADRDARRAVAWQLAESCGLDHQRTPRAWVALDIGAYELDGAAREGVAAYTAPATTDDLGAARAAMEADLEWLSVARGDVLFRRGDPGDAVYFVVSGRLRAILELPGGVRVLNEIGRGEILGEMGVIAGQPRSATIDAVRDSELVRLSKTSFDRLVRAHPDAMMGIVRLLIQRLERAQSRDRKPNTAITFAIVPGSPGVPIDGFCRDLAEALRGLGPTLHLTAARVDEAIEPGASQVARNDANHGRVLAWLTEQEAHVRYVIYEADPTPSAWTQRCARQADRVLVLVASNQRPGAHPIDATFLAPSDGAAGRAATYIELVLHHPPGTVRPSGTAGWLANWRPITHHHLLDGSRDDISRLARRITGRAVGIAFGGGGTRGLAHIGVVRAFEEAGISIDVIGGTSAGSFVGAQLAMGWDSQTMLERNRELISRAKKLFDFTIPLVSFLASRKLDDVLTGFFDDVRIEDLWRKYFCVSCNLSRAELAVHEEGLVRRRVRSSMSVPGVLPPVNDAGDLFVDGSVVDSVPTDVLLRLMDGGTIAAVDVSLDIFLAGEYDLLERFTGTQLLWHRINPFRRRRVDLPNILSIMARAAELGSVRTRLAQKHLADIYVLPDLGTMGIFEINRFDETIAAGFRAAQQAITEWQSKQANTTALPDTHRLAPLR